MLKRITKISAQNFSEAVDYANALNKKRIVTIRVRKLLLPLGSFMFALHALLLSLGALYALASETELVAFEAVGFIPGYWNGVTGLLDGITTLEYLQALLMMLYLYFVPFVVCSVAALVIARTTKATPLTVTGSTAERAKQLCLFCGKIPYAQELNDDVQRRWRRISGLSYLVALVGFFLYFIVVLSGQGEDATDEYLFALIEGLVGLLIALALLYWVYTLCHRLFILTIAAYYKDCDQRIRLTAEARSYWVSVDPAEREKLKKEAKAKEEKQRKERERQRASTSYSGYTGGYSTTSTPMSYGEKADYIRKNCLDMFSYGGIQTIENDPNLTASQKEDLKRHLMIYGD